MTDTIKKEFILNILIKKENNEFVAHCLDFDIIAVAATKKQAKEDIESLICAHIEYGLLNDNLDHVFYSAPKEAWEEFKRCTTERRKWTPENPYFDAEMCEANNLTPCHA